MSSFLIKEKTEKSFEDKISKLLQSTKGNIKAARNSFYKFCSEYYEGRSSDEIFKELNILEPKE